MQDPHNNKAFEVLLEQQMVSLRPLLGKYPDGAEAAKRDARMRAFVTLMFGRPPGTSGVYEVLLQAGRVFDLKGAPLDLALVDKLASGLGDAGQVFASFKVAPFVRGAIELDWIGYWESSASIGGLQNYNGSIVIGIDWSVLELVDGKVCGFDVQRCFIVDNYQYPDTNSTLKSPLAEAKSTGNELPAPERTTGPCPS